MSSEPRFFWRSAVPADRRPVLRLSAAGRNDLRYDVRLVGMLSRNRFVVTHPTAGGSLVFVRDGDGFEVSTFDGALLYRFDTVVRGVRLGDAPSLELTLPPPESRRQEALRRARRLPVTLPCSVRYGAGDEHLRSGFVADLSPLGARIALEEPLPGGVDRMQVAFRVEALGRAQTVQVRAAVRSASVDPRPDMPAKLYGLEFESLEPGSALLVSHFVLDRLLAMDEDIFSAVR